MVTPGGIILSKRLSDLEAALRDYLGALNEIKMGIRNKMPPKPKPLVEYERCKELGLPLVAGGISDQPYIWLQEVAVIIEQQTLFRLIEESQRERSGAP